MNESKSTIALILDDHLFFGQSFAVTLEHNGFVESAFAYTSPSEITKYIIQHREHAIYLFLDYHIPDVNVFHLINDVRRMHPKVKIVMLSSVTNPALIKKILEYNPEGFLSKMVGINELADCMSRIKKGQVYISDFIQQAKAKESEASVLDTFTAKEMEVLGKLAKGESIEEMAASLNISRNTVIVHRRNMMAKAGTKSVTALLALAIQKGVITANQPGG